MGILKRIGRWYIACVCSIMKILMVAKSTNVGVNGGNMKAIDIANYFIGRANENAENDLTNLKLQKILYLAQGNQLGRKGESEPLFIEPVEAWQYGPVVRDVYNTFSICGASPITLLDMPEQENNLAEETIHFLDEIWNQYGKYSAAYLVTLTHNQDPWINNYKEGSKQTIPATDMVNYFAA